MANLYDDITPRDLEIRAFNLHTNMHKVCKATARPPLLPAVHYATWEKWNNGAARGKPYRPGDAIIARLMEATEPPAK